MKKTRKIVLVLLLPVTLGLIICGYFIGDKEERFMISDFEVNILCPKNKTKENCFNLHNYNADSINISPKILAIKFKLKYLSVRREHLFDHMPPGGEGPVDFIKSIEIIDEKNTILENSILTDASEYKHFKYDDSKIDPGGHSADNRGCLESETFNSVQDFISYYNFNSDKDSKFRDVTLPNYHFFILNYSMIRSKLTHLKLKFEMGDGRTLIREIN